MLNSFLNNMSVHDYGTASVLVKQHKLYHGIAVEVDRFRSLLDLDEPKFVTGEKPDEVLSDWSYT